MSRHVTNIAAFVTAADVSGDLIIRSYCGMVAIELVLKEAMGLSDHNVPAALNHFANKFAVGHLYGCKARLNAIATQLSNAIAAISVQGIDGKPRAAPAASYPYIRYTRHVGDGWTVPSTTVDQAQALTDAVMNARAYLKQKFGKPL
jgi:hypothetical protein